MRLSKEQIQKKRDSVLALGNTYMEGVEGKKKQKTVRRTEKGIFEVEEELR